MIYLNAQNLSQYIQELYTVVSIDLICSQKVHFRTMEYIRLI